MSLFGNSREDTPTSEFDNPSSIPPAPLLDDHHTSQQRRPVGSIYSVRFAQDSDLEGDLDGEKSADRAEQQENTSLSKNELNSYRRWFDQEIFLVNSLETIRAGDLSRNVFGAAIERNVAEPVSGLSPWLSRYRWAVTERERKTLPPASWTAWPLTPNSVPSAEEWFDKPQDDMHRPTKRMRLPKPSDELEEALCDLAVQNARENWNLENHKLQRRPEKERSALTREEITTSTSVASVPATLLHHPTSSTHQQDMARLESQNVIGNDRPSQSSQDRSHPLDLAESVADLIDPVFSADDERSHRLLQPTIRSIMSGLDELLFGLYHSRLGHDKHHRDKSNGQTTKLSGIIASSPKSKQTESSSASTDGNGQNSSSQQRHTIEYGLRDWSDVLGMASLTGWNPDIVKRATQKCAQLFGESMSYTTLDADIVHIPPADIVGHPPGPTICPNFEHKWSLDDLLCPHEDCPRRLTRFQNPRRLRWHIKGVHKWDPLSEERPRVMVGGVHVDGFMQEIPARAGWRGKDKTKSDQRGIKRRRQPT
jgi:N-terminal acetyltransferase B complex catalytic subunit